MVTDTQEPNEFSQYMNSCKAGVGCQLTQKQHFGVTGIYDCCGHWLGAIEKAAYNVQGVLLVRANDVDKTVMVEHTTESTLDDIKKAVQEAGYTPVDLE